eukprot:2866649-Ditylum_brightwellii.AAC.1
MAKSSTSLIPSFPNSSIVSFATSIYLELAKKVVVCILLRPSLVLATASVMADQEALVAQKKED